MSEFPYTTTPEQREHLADIADQMRAADVPEEMVLTTLVLGDRYEGIYELAVLWSEEESRSERAHIIEDIRKQAYYSAKRRYVKGSTMDQAVTFVSYDGRYPCLCSGTLTYRVDGRTVAVNNCLVSGGQVSFDSEWNPSVTKNPWLCSDEFAKSSGLSKSELESLLRQVNASVDHGCCGGCV